MARTTSVTGVTLPQAGAYRVDPARTVIGLVTRHLFGLGEVVASFKVREATVTIGDPITATTLRAVIDATSFASGNPKRDRDVRGPKFLDADVYPDITVTADSATGDDGRWLANATVIAHGVARQATLLLEAADVTAEGILTCRATMRVDRYAHGITAGKGMAGRWMNLTVNAVASAA